MPNPLPDGEPSSSRRLLERARRGDGSAMERLFARHLDSLRRWARGRLPRAARDAGDTEDLVQEAAANVFRRLPHFEPRRDQALRAYLRQAVRNRVRDALRQRQRRPAPAEIDEQAPAGGPSPLHAAIEAENASRYRAGLERLRPEERELVVARLELGYSYEQIALALGRASPDAVRVAVRRAMLRLAEVMGGG
jgi:RNA polymerase sigma-70 factor (ECF subfamily)